MTVEVEFSLPYTLSDMSRLEDVERDYESGKSDSSPSLTGSRTVMGDTIVFRGEGVPSDYSQKSREAFISAMETYFNDAVLEEFRDVE